MPRCLGVLQLDVDEPVAIGHGFGEKLELRAVVQPELLRRFIGLGRRHGRRLRQAFGGRTVVARRRQGLAASRDGMHRPIVFRETFARPDLDVAGLRRQDGREFHDAAVAQFERADDLQIGDLDLVAAVILLGGGNGDFDETAAREDRLAVDHVFGEIREEMRVDVVFPASRIGVAAPAVEPIGLCGTSEEIRRIGRGRRPQFHRLEGQRGSSMNASRLP